MSRFVIDELVAGTPLFQEIVPTRNIHLNAIRLGLYKHNAPAGNVKVRITDTSDKIIKESAAITITDISSANFSHGMVRFDIDTPLKKDHSYRIALVDGGGYAFAESAYVGWKRDSDFKSDATRRVPASYVGNNGVNAPFDLELWERRRIDKGEQ